MPWHSLHRPSLALGILRSACASEDLPIPDTYHANLRFGAMLLDAGFTVDDYAALADTGFHFYLGEWVFAGALYHPDFGMNGMRDLAARHGLPLQTATAVRGLAGKFVDTVVDDVLASGADLVGFSATFSQTVASLAVARRLKSRRPELQVAFGGYSAEGPMGQALHAEFGFVDYVVRGEGDVLFPQLLRALALEDRAARDAALAAIPQLCWRDQHGTAHVNTTPATLVPPTAMRRPRYTDWFEQMPPRLRAHLVPELVVESSRGCWWGAKHHCTFCGLNGAGMTYRAKPAETFVAEVTDLVRRHQILDITVVDNILPSDYLRTALPALAQAAYDWRLHYEIKANLKPADVATLRAARVWGVQPGIESLVDDVLSRMDKGVRSVHNVRMLRDGSAAGLAITWSWLFGFPGEQEQDYRAVVDQLSALVHLQPPDGLARINLQRYSPNYDRPELGFTPRWPAEGASLVFDVPADRLADLVYSFDTPDQGLTDEQAAPLAHALNRWKALYPHSFLTERTIGGMLIIRDRRAGWPAIDHTITSAAEQLAWNELRTGRSLPALHRALTAAGHRWSSSKLDGWIRLLTRHGLLFGDAGRWITVPTDPQLNRDEPIAVTTAPPAGLPLTVLSA